jgi:hypothetical protein
MMALHFWKICAPIHLTLYIIFETESIWKAAARKREGWRKKAMKAMVQKEAKAQKRRKIESIFK